MKLLYLLEYVTVRIYVCKNSICLRDKKILIFHNEHWFLLYICTAIIR